MKDLGDANKILGMKIHTNMKAKRLYLSLKEYIEKVLEWFAIQNSKRVNTPLTAHFRLSITLSL